MAIDTSNYNSEAELGSTPVTLEMLLHMSKDLRQSVSTIGANEARYLVDFYYSLQRQRISTNNATIAMEKSEESHQLLEFFRNQTLMLEKQVSQALDSYTSALPIGRWARQTKGIGPVITAGMLAHIDINKAPTVGHIYSFAGHNPTVKWEKGQKRPWNAKLKVLCWKTGEAFVKVSSRKEAEYGYLYKFRKDLEILRNERGDYKAQAAEKITSGKYAKDTDAKKHYASGKLPPAQLHLRATRWAVQVYLSHLHTVWYWLEFNKMPPRPYAFSHMEHKDYMLPPNLVNYAELQNGLREQFPHGRSIEDWIGAHRRHMDSGQF